VITQKKRPRQRNYCSSDGRVIASELGQTKVQYRIYAIDGSRHARK